MRAQSLIAVDVVKFFGERRILDGIHLTANPGQRLGLVGENGAGKTTLLRLLAGADNPDAGDITRPADTGLLHQELPFTAGQTVGDVIADALRESHDLLRRLDQLLHQPHRLTEYGAVLQRAEQINAWDADRRADEIMHGLGLPAIGRQRTLGTLSGGQRSRVALAALLVSRPAALLLDEPTNHLDDQAVAFVETQLRQLPGVVIVASHDRVFLDEVCTDIIDLDPARGGITRYGGAYSAYLDAKKAERLRWEQAFANQQDEMNALRHAINTTARQVAHGRPPRDGNKMSYNAHGEKVQASIASRVRNATQRLETLQRHQIRKPPAQLHFQAPPLTTKDTGDGHLVSIRDLHIPGRIQLQRLDIEPGQRLLVTGPNGSGKSSLLHAIAGTLHSGNVLRRKGLRVGLLAQDDTWPDLTRTPRQLYGHHETPLADLGLVAPKDLDRPIATLSVGQRRRLALAQLIADPPHLLLLDEPTNHLSLTLADELENALGTAPGAVIIATHDRWLRRRWQHPELTLNSTPTQHATT
ncbi:ABC transporter ATP-binding protein [Rhizocola hellebori]|uniref:ABC transporter ATP-binding protein n=1 Tax=Rhizocola hellebori TaxID=1392758 RepID=A0A8J3Q5E5_9ACTN|nr:ABC-F family ATP-binding cassette domain-containing protein [Rhizocola hellebori]GIH04081.1 ABC transporter ATP-binding protein [Rhizocola hellebori]